MKIFFKTGVSALTLLAFWLMAIASSPSKMTFGNTSKWIPADFNPSKTVLLIQTFDVSAKAQAKMEEYMQEKYPYKYEFVSLATIKSKTGMHANTSLYKYALVITSQTTSTYDASRNRSGPAVTGFDFNFYNRETGVDYPTTGKPSSFAIMTFKPVINSIVKKFE